MTLAYFPVSLCFPVRRFSTSSRRSPAATRGRGSAVASRGSPPRPRADGPDSEPLNGNYAIVARRAARRERAERERRIVGLLNDGHSVAEIAAREGLTQRRMRAVAPAILARRVPPPPAGFAALQIGRLSTRRCPVSFNAMSGANLQAVDRIVEIVRELAC